jgi:myo-inositol 2-dehydrogenase/D-chiro-inositol 1-dehydrogenase/scyllo-inositol 2-dehydrogenase (NAD+)
LTVGICVIGTGRVGVLHSKNISLKISKAKLVGVYDINKESAQKLSSELKVKVFNSLEEISQDEKVHAVIITTPTYTHAEIASYFMNHKKHVFCEKPLALSLEEANNMKEIKEKNRVKFQLGFMRRFDPEFLEAKKIIDNGEIGEIMSIRSITRGPGLPPEWTWDIEKSNGFLAEVNSHDFDTVRWLTNSNFKEIFAFGVVKKAKEISIKYPNFYDTSVVNFILENNTLGVIEGSCPVEYGYDARVEILGTKGLLIIGDIKGQSPIMCNVNKDIIIKSSKSWQERFKEAYILEIEHFVDCILEDKEPSVGIYDGIEALKAVLCANKSIKEKRPVLLNDL